MARRKHRENKSKFFGTKQVLKDMNAPAHAVLHDYDPTGVSVANFVGTISLFSLDTPPRGWLECNGAAVSRTTYNNLFAVIGTTYGAGDGSTTFNLPDMQDRFPVGKGTTFSSIGGTGGAVNHTHSVSLSGSTDSESGHTHGAGTYVNGNANATTDKTGGGGTAASAGHGHNISGTSGGGGSHSHTVTGTGATSGNNNPPYITIIYIIKT